MHIKNDILFPKLSPEQLDIAKQYGLIEDYDLETILFRSGDVNFSCYVVLEGYISILDSYSKDKELVRHSVGEFSGDSDMLSSRSAIVTARSSAQSKLLRIDSEALKRLVASEATLSDIFITAFLGRRNYLINQTNYGYKIIGSRFSPQTYSLREFFRRNFIPHQWIDLEKDKEASLILEQLSVKASETPIIFSDNGQLHRNPSLINLAKEFGVNIDSSKKEYDLLIVGAGPAGLAASVYAASEGLKTLTIDSHAPGGQAASSSKIENYLGFPTGISGQDLANNAYIQAQKFGCEISIPAKANSLKPLNDGSFMVSLDGNTEVHCKSIIIATGAKYRKLNLDRLSDFEGKGIYYAATLMEAQTCAHNDTVIVVGAGNSAGQGTIFLSSKAKEVILVVRGSSLEASMSKYLIDRIYSTPNIKVYLNSEISQLEGKEHLEAITCKKLSGEEIKIETCHVFTLIGAKPCTDWTQPYIKLDEKGFIVTGSEVLDTKSMLTKSNHISPLETNLAGVFAVGDVRSSSTKRVASAVGEGSMAVSLVHQYLSKV